MVLEWIKGIVLSVLYVVVLFTLIWIVLVLPVHLLQSLPVEVQAGVAVVFTCAVGYAATRQLKSEVAKARKLHEEKSKAKSETVGLN